MTNEEKKAIETIKDLKEIKWYEHAFDKGTEILSEEEKQDIDVILNLLKKQDNRIKKLESDNYECNNIIRDYIEDWKLKTKIIDLMAEQLKTPINSKKDVIDYFENLAKESGEIDEG